MAEVQVAQLGHVHEGAADLNDGVVGHVQGGEAAEGVEGVAGQGGDVVVALEKKLEIRIKGENIL